MDAQNIYNFTDIQHVAVNNDISVYQEDTLLGQFNVDEVIHDSTSSVIKKITFENEGFWNYSITSLTGGNWTMWESYLSSSPSIANFGVAYETIKYDLTNHSIYKLYL